MEFLNVCLNDSNGNPSKIYVFSGGNKIEPSKLFRAIDLIEFEKHDIEYIYVEQYIYKDDNIKNVKRKILDALKYEISYPEIYLYAKTSSEYSLDDIFNNIIKDTNNDFVNYEQVKQLINNFVNFDIEIPKKDEYSASDLYDLNIPSTIDFLILLAHNSLIIMILCFPQILFYYSHLIYIPITVQIHSLL